MSAEILFFIDMAARSFVVLALAWGAVLAFPRLSAAARYGIWFVALCALPLLPVSSVLFPVVTLFEVAEPAQKAVATFVAVPAPEMPQVDVFTEVTPSLPPARKPQGAGTSVPKPQRIPLTLTIYCTASIMLLLPIAAGLLRLRILRKRALPFVDEPHVFISADVTIPITWGKIILLPKAAVDWPDERLRVVLAHERAHIARRDFATGLVAAVVKAAFWFQPLAWLALRRLRAEREIACDDRVLQSAAASAPDYAQHLSEVVRGAQRPVGIAVAMARPSEIVGRVRAILDSARNRGALSRRARGRIALVALAVIAPLAFVRCAGEKTETAESALETGLGIKLQPVKADGFKINYEGNTWGVPGGGSYFMAECEVSQADFEKIMGHNPSSVKGGNLPADRVTLTEAKSFCAALTERDRAGGILAKGKVYRLPTLREWRAAAIPGGQFPQGELSEIAWIAANSAETLHPVGSKKANALGLHDLIGNVAEWTLPDAALNTVADISTPSRYCGRVVIQIRADGSTTTLVAANMEIIQIALMKSPSVFKSVIEELDLTTKWGIKDNRSAQTRLANSLDITYVRGTDLVALDYYDEDPNDAAEIANGIASALIENLREQFRKRLQSTLDGLNEPIHDQREKVDKARIKLLDMMEKYDSFDNDNGGKEPAWMRGGTVEIESGVGTLVVGAWKQFDFLKISALDGTALVDAIKKVKSRGEALQSALLEYEKSLQEAATLQGKGLGEKHPKVLLAEQQSTRLKTLLLDEVRTAMSSEPVEKPAKSSIDERMLAIEYVEAKKDYEIQKGMLNKLMEVYPRVDRATFPFFIYEKATVPTLPTKRKVSSEINTHFAVGGTAFDNLPTMLRFPAASENDERKDGVGFRFVMADE